MSNQTKVWKTKAGPLQGDKALSGDPKSALFEILQNKEHYDYFSKTEYQKCGFNIM